MKMIRTFWKDEDGAVTVDWVVLTAAVVVLAVAVATTITPAVNTEVGQIATVITDTTN